MSGGSKLHPVNIKELMESRKKHKDEIHRLRDALDKIERLDYFFQGAYWGATEMRNIAREALNTKTVHLHKTSYELLWQGAKATVPILEKLIEIDKANALVVPFYEKRKELQETLSLFHKGFERRVAE